MAADGAQAEPMAGAHGVAVTLGDLTIADGFTRAMPNGARSGGGFLTITNAGGQVDRLISVSSPNAAMVELHEMRMENDRMIMRPQADGIVIPAGETVMLKPGGLHIMFMQVTTPFVEGETVPVTLTFEKAGAVDVMLPVGGFAAAGAADADSAK